MSETDLSKIVGLIMENPKLIEEIKNLSSKAEGKEEVKLAEKEKTSEANTELEEAEATIAPIENTSRIRRRELLSALKPYVSEERGKAIDSVMSIADILDVMRSK